MKHRQFGVILFLVAAVWLVMTMSEYEDYPLEVRIRWTGYDGSRYIVTSADTLVSINFNSNNFQAWRRYRATRRKDYVIEVKGDTVVKVNKLFFDDVSRQMGFSGSRGATSDVEELHFKVTQRERMPFVPQLRGVDFVFAAPWGLAGEPTLHPDTVWLYGDPAVLRRISEVATAPATIANITDSGRFMLALKPDWKRFGDVQSSTDSVCIVIPSEKFVETTLDLPVDFEGKWRGEHLHLYPDHVRVTVWVPEGDFDQISEARFKAVVNYDTTSPQDELPVRITQFPARTRLKSVSPSTISYVIVQ